MRVIVFFFLSSAYSPGFLDNLGGVCYRFIVSALNWADSRTACEADNGQIAVLDSDGKIDWIKAARQSVGSGYGMSILTVSSPRNTSSNGHCPLMLSSHE